MARMQLSWKTHIGPSAGPETVKHTILSDISHFCFFFFFLSHFLIQLLKCKSSFCLSHSSNHCHSESAFAVQGPYIRHPLWLWDCMDSCVLCSFQLLVTPWTVTLWAPLSMGFPRQEYSGVGYHFLLQGILLT